MARSSLGSIQRVGNGVWKVVVELPPDAATGKRRRMSRNVRGSKRDAEKAKQRMLVQAGGSPSRDLSVGEWWETYIAECSTRLRPNTVHGYEMKWNEYLVDRWGDVPLQSIRPADVSAWIATIDAAGSRRFNAYKLLRQILNRAVRNDLLQSNPCDRVEVPKRPRHEPRVLDAAQAAEYLRLFHGTALEAAIIIAIGCGLRRSEVVALDWADVRDGLVVVDNAVTSVAGKPHDDAPKSAFSTRKVTVPRSLYARLEELRQDDDVPVLLDRNGNRMNPDNYTSAYSRVLDSLPEGVPRVPLRDLRHTSLTLALEGGASLVAVSRRGGHGSTAITSAYYLRPHQSVDEQVAEGLNELLAPFGT